MSQLSTGSPIDLRVGDAEREHVAGRLRTAHAEGRLDSEELQQRIDRCLSARTAGDLRALVADLPSEPPANPDAGSMRRGHLRAPAWVPLIVAVWVALALAGAAVHGHGPGLWLIVPLFLFLRAVFGRGTRRPARWQ